MTNIRQLMKQAQEMQEKMQRELAELEVTTSVGGGMVTATMNGHKHLLRIEIEPEAMDPDDPELLEDLIVAAVNQAVQRVDEDMQGRLGSMTAGLPNLF